jgi:hypothetical protein
MRVLTSFCVQGGAAVAHSVKEPRQSMTRGLAASAVSKQ